MFQHRRNGFPNAQGRWLPGHLGVDDALLKRESVIVVLPETAVVDQIFLGEVFEFPELPLVTWRKREELVLKLSHCVGFGVLKILEPLRHILGANVIHDPFFCLEFGPQIPQIARRTAHLLLFEHGRAGVAHCLCHQERLSTCREPRRGLRIASAKKKSLWFLFWTNKNRI